MGWQESADERAHRVVGRVFDELYRFSSTGQWGPDRDLKVEVGEEVALALEGIRSEHGALSVPRWKETLVGGLTGAEWVRKGDYSRGVVWSERSMECVLGPPGWTPVWKRVRSADAAPVLNCRQGTSSFGGLVKCRVELLSTQSHAVTAARRASGLKSVESSWSTCRSVA